MIPVTRGCSLSAKFGPAFQAEYERRLNIMLQSLGDDAALNQARHTAHEAGSSALASLGPYGAMVAAFAEGLDAMFNLDEAESRERTIAEFQAGIRELCIETKEIERREAEKFRWNYLQQLLAKQGREGPSWEVWQGLPEALRLQWLPADAEPIEMLRARVAEREQRFETARRAVWPRHGWLVTTTGRIVRGPWVKL